MKKIFILIVFLYLYTNVQADFVNANECKTDIYFGNGVWNL